jgi:hypothetical protein
MYKIQAKERMTAFLRTRTHLSNLLILDSKLRTSFLSHNGPWMSANAPGDAAWQLEDPIGKLINPADDLQTRLVQGAVAAKCYRRSSRDCGK